MAKSEHRRQAIAKTVASFLDENHDYVLVHAATADTMAQSVRELADLGRSGKWKTTIEEWAMLIEGAADKRWALLQGQVQANNAA